MSEASIFLIEIVILGIMAAITWFMKFVNILGFDVFGMGGIVAGLLLAGGAGMIYTANNRKELLHYMAFIMILAYLLGLVVEFVYPIGAWFVNIAQSGTLGWFAAVLVGLFVLMELILSVVDAHAQHMK
jgi:hypothetical protein